MINKIKEIFSTTIDLARVIPVTKAKLPDNDDFESMGLVLEETAAKYPNHIMIIFEGEEITCLNLMEKPTHLLAQCLIEG